jgi:hypothetical protein
MRTTTSAQVSFRETRRRDPSVSLIKTSERLSMQSTPLKATIARNDQSMRVFKFPLAARVSVPVKSRPHPNKVSLCLQLHE